MNEDKNELIVYHNTVLKPFMVNMAKTLADHFDDISDNYKESAERIKQLAIELEQTSDIVKQVHIIKQINEIVGIDDQ
jgi:hypothetical protein